MNVLITSATHPFAQFLAGSLAASHAVFLTDRSAVTTEHPFTLCHLDHDETCDALVAGKDAIVHVAEPLPIDDEFAQIDFFTRRTYNLLWAASRAQLRRVVLLSSLSLMAAYDERYIVHEHWRPRPHTAAPILGRHLCEWTCREFAREHKLHVVVLRLGNVTNAGVTLTSTVGLPTEDAHVDARSAAHAVERALTADLDIWSVFHILADSPNPRFPITEAQQRLGYQPVTGAR